MRNLDIHTIQKITVAKKFGLAASQYDAAAVLQTIVGEKLMERLISINHEPNNILDLGSGTGKLTELLYKAYPKANVMGLDIAEGMISFAKQSLNTQVKYVCADAEKIPLVSSSFDIIFSNCTLQWSFNLEVLFKEILRILKPGGKFLFSTFGPDTLKELKDSLFRLNTDKEFIAFIDMHNIGDLLLAAGLNVPVMDVENYSLTYSSVKDLLMDLKNMGANFLPQSLNSKFNRKINLKNLSHSYEIFRTIDGELPASFEVIFGYAEKNSLSNKDQPKLSDEIPKVYIPEVGRGR